MQKLANIFRLVVPVIVFFWATSAFSASIYDISPQQRASQDAAADRASNEKMVFTAVTGAIVVALIVGGVVIYRRK